MADKQWQSPVQVQPRQGTEWMATPQSVTGIPQGLEYLSALDQIIVKQRVELLEVITGFETKNKYDVLNSVGQQCYFAQEESECCHRICCGSNREYVIHISDNMGQEVMRVRHDFVCCVGCCWCATDSSCGYEVQIEAPVGNIIGYAKQQTSKWKPHFRVFDANRQPLYVVRGPCCGCQAICCTDDVNFPVSDLTETNVLGRIFKRWAGCGRESFTDADTFGVSFPIDMAVTSKALLFGTVFLVDFLYYEHSEDDNNQ
ncbi:phospholipid scramblase 1-like [Saccostrea echinata]|uniref:phospholipid scramblase 1-like n=1 Tax=Saccostrea echinata TaxID=191078 RepID=UPI002A83ED3B|nr:phospholipid scramblase 1-like [Saccostrea echinata]